MAKFKIAVMAQIRGNVKVKAANLESAFLAVMAQQFKKLKVKKIESLAIDASKTAKLNDLAIKTKSKAKPKKKAASKKLASTVKGHK